MAEEQESHVEIDPDTGIINTVFDDDKEISAEDQLWQKNPARTHALRDIIFDDLVDHMKDQDLPEDKRWEMTFFMAVNSVLDLFMDSLPEDMAMDASYCFDNFIGLALANKKYDVNILGEAKKAIDSVDPKAFDSEELFAKGVEEFEEKWWNMGQPALGMRSPNDAIIESLAKYGLNKE